MTNAEERATALLLAADHLERWAEDLPRWTAEGAETWYEFADRRYEAELALIDRLQLAPDSLIRTCPLRMKLGLTLGGISISTQRGLAAACREWAESARAAAELTCRSADPPADQDQPSQEEQQATGCDH